jgi:hypothetical protein
MVNLKCEAVEQLPYGSISRTPRDHSSRAISIGLCTTATLIAHSIAVLH